MCICSVGGGVPSKTGMGRNKLLAFLRVPRLQRGKKPQWKERIPSRFHAMKVAKQKTTRPPVGREAVAILFPPHRPHSSPPQRAPSPPGAAHPRRRAHPPAGPADDQRWGVGTRGKAPIRPVAGCHPAPYVHPQSPSLQTKGAGCDPRATLLSTTQRKTLKYKSYILIFLIKKQQSPPVPTHTPIPT